MIGYRQLSCLNNEDKKLFSHRGYEGVRIAKEKNRNFFKLKDSLFFALVVAISRGIKNHARKSNE